MDPLWELETLSRTMEMRVKVAKKRNGSAARQKRVEGRIPNSQFLVRFRNTMKLP